MASTINIPRAILIKSNKDDQEDWNLFLSFVLRLVIYVIVLASTLIIVSVIVKYMRDCGSEAMIEQLTASETNRLIQKEVTSTMYGTYDEAEDVEAGRWSSSSSEGGTERWNGKICAICYEQQRNCFFVPCGHCAACSVCARRIIAGESKSCPFCRRLIRKVATEESSTIGAAKERQSVGELESSFESQVTTGWENGRKVGRGFW